MGCSAPKGVFDIFPCSRTDKDQWRHSSYWIDLENVIREKSGLYGFNEIRTPVLEKTELFSSLGEWSDIIKKETYTFLDRKGRSLTLRPEGTAPVIRAFIEHKLYEKSKESKFFYILPMFRYERQQAGRYRQHHQFGAESIGVRHPYRDVEVICLLWDFYRDLGLKGLVLHINSLGNSVSVTAYNEVLKKFFQAEYDDLSSLSRERFDRGSLLRILDSKEQEDQRIIEEAPRLLDFLDESSSIYFEKILELLQDVGINYEINHKLVRGLDYYTDIVFEVTAPLKSAQNAIGGGGRYDGLVSKLSGPDLPSCGFGTGLERVIQTLMDQNYLSPKASSLLKILPLGEEFESFCFELVRELRDTGIVTDIDLTRRDLKIMLRSAAAEGIGYVIAVGETELRDDKFILKDMNRRTETYVSRCELKERLLAKYEI
ncbi:MAG: histidine--tRNA ligase [Victivallaceae bacterium]